MKPVSAAQANPRGFQEPGEGQIGGSSLQHVASEISLSYPQIWLPNGNQNTKPPKIKDLTVLVVK